MKHFVINTNIIKYSFVIFFCFFFLKGITQINNPKQTNQSGGDILADVPWRMKKTDVSGNLNRIPVHVFIKDADGVGSNVELIYLNIYIKNATDTSFGDPIVFNTYSDSAFLSLFSSKSVTDSALDIQSFDASLPVKDTNYTIQFTVNNCIWPYDCKYVDITHKFWYFTIGIPPEKLLGFDDIIDIKVSFTLNWSADIVSYLRVFRYDNDFPKLSGWYRGDTHYHTMYTNSIVEFGLPLDATKKTAKVIGLDWLTSSNHSCDYDNYGTSMQNNWSKEKTEIQTLNIQDSSMIFIHSLEASGKNSAGNVVHLLCYPPSSLPYSLPLLGDGHGDMTSTSVTIDNFLDSLSINGGFAYAAHPFAGGDKFTFLVDGGIWNVGDTSFLSNGSQIQGNDVVICNDNSYASDLYSLNSGQELFKSKIKGGEIWNYKNSLTTTDEFMNPWNVMYDNGVTAFTLYDSASTLSHYNRFLQGLEVSKFLNKKGLIMKNSNNNLINYKFFITAGSDAHGDFNYSNTSFYLGLTSDINDAAIGKPSTLVYCPSGMGNAGSNVLNSLENGNVIISDGPLVSIGISTDGNNNTPEYIIGQEALPSIAEYANAKLLINLANTPEFGYYDDLKIIVGTQNGEYALVLPVDSALLNLTYVYNLDSILQQALAGDSIQKNEYFYLRAEISTFKNYYPLESIYKKPYDFFYCFTNPIWLKKPSALFINENDISHLVCNVYPNPFINSIQIHLNNINNSYVKVDLYNVFGSIVQTKNIGSIEKGGDYFLNTMNLQEGVYLLKVNTGNKILNFKLIKTSYGKTE